MSGLGPSGTRSGNAATHPPREGGAVAPEYRIEDLAQASGATVRTIRAYQDRGLLPAPERRGRANVYGEIHLTRLGQIAGLLDRGYTLTSIRELLDAWDTGRGLGGVLGLVAEVQGPWSDEEAVRITRAELEARFGRTPGGASAGDADAVTDEVVDAVTDGFADAVADAVALGVLEPVPGSDDTFLVPSPQELSVAVELHAAGVPLSAISVHLGELRQQVEHIASRFLEFTTEHVFARYAGHRGRTDTDAAEAASMVRRLRPLAQQVVDAELARAMGGLASRHLQKHLTAPDPPGVRPGPRPVFLPASTMQAVQDLVGPQGVALFIAAAAEREVQARALDALTSSHANSAQFDQTP